MKMSDNEQGSRRLTQPTAEESARSPGRPELEERAARASMKIDTSNTIYNYFSSAKGKREKLSEDLVEDLPQLPPHLHAFREPRHSLLVSELENRRVLLLTSYQATAAYVTAFSLLHDDHFSRQLKRTLSISSRLEREGSDFNILDLVEDNFLSEKPQVMLIEINRHCTFLDSVLELGYGTLARIADRLERHCSYLVLAINEDLIRDEDIAARVRNGIPFYTVSHLRYLLSRDLADRAEEFERRLLAALEHGTYLIDLREIYQTVVDRLREGVAAFEAFLLETEKANDLPLASGKKRWDVFISHASEDKEDIAEPLALLLREMGLNVWYDDFVLRLGDRLRRSIEHGLAESQFGVVLLSPNFFRKEWTQRELDGLLALEGDRGLILPVWHGLGIDHVKRFSPILADRVGISTSKGLTSVANQIFEAVRGHKR
jgi:hypothetical protein